MSRARPDQPLAASLVDRLSEDGRAGPPRLAELKRAVRRDMEMLLNSRRRAERPGEDLTELALSVVSYGIPDFTGLDLATEDRRGALVREVEETIRRFEPRFLSVEVSRMENTDPYDRTMRLRIEALMHAEPAPEPLVLASRFDPSLARFSVSGSDAG